MSSGIKLEFDSYMIHIGIIYERAGKRDVISVGLTNLFSLRAAILGSCLKPLG